jgi:hypothetical protein
MLASITPSPPTGGEEKRDKEFLVNGLIRDYPAPLAITGEKNSFGTCHPGFDPEEILFLQPNRLFKPAKLRGQGNPLTSMTNLGKLNYNR